MANPLNPLAEFFTDLEQTAVLWQLGVLLACLTVAWISSGLLKKNVPEQKGAWKLGMGGVSRVMFPLTALALVMLAKTLLQNWFSIKLLNIAASLLLALALVRLAVYMLRHVFAPSGWLHASERYIAVAIWAGLALHLTGFLPEIFDTLDGINIRLGKQHISVLMILSGMLSVIVTLLAAMWLGGVLEDRLMRAEKMDLNLRVVLSKLLRAALIVIAILIALPAAGIDITVLSVFSGALGVGLGFGLQKIASNYVSGFIILLDRSIHPGDVLTVDNRFGTVSRVTTRYLVLRGNDGTEAIIPNDTLITSTVLNHSYSDRQMRIALSIQVSYRSDLEKAMEIMRRAAENHARVLQDPPPRTFLKAFGENGIEIELAVWIIDPEEGQLNLRSELNLEIWRNFQASQIEIPYPQREVRLLNGSAEQPRTA